MVASRVKGVANTFVLVQLVVVTAFYWISAWIWEAMRGVHPAGLKPFVFYNEFLLLGILALTQASRRDLAQGENGTRFAFQLAGRQTFAGLFTVFMVALALGDRNFPRGFLFTFAPVLYLVLCLSNRFLARGLAGWFFSAGHQTPVLLVGNPQRVPHLNVWLEGKKAFGLAPVGYVEGSDQDGTLQHSAFPCVGRFADIESIIDRMRIKQVILLELSRWQPQLRELTSLCEARGLRLLVISDLEKQFRHSIRFFNDEGLQFIGLRDEPLEDPVNRLLKRALDLTVSLPVVLLILPPATLMVWLLHRLQSPGPVFYIQERAGLENRPFRMIKFRTMHTNHGREDAQATREDSRIFPAGAWLRKLSLDELPQFINVLRGEMSVVGPRPHLTAHNRVFAQEMSNYHVRSIVKPGISGLAQVRGYRGETKKQEDIVHRVTADIAYLENWSIGLDCVIILKTIRQMVLPPANAY